MGVILLYSIWVRLQNIGQLQMPPLRPATAYTNYIRKNFPVPFFKADLGCAAPVKDEIIGSLEMYSEIKAFGKDLLKARGHQDLTTAFLQFQAYMRQARTFFEAAEALHHRALDPRAVRELFDLTEEDAHVYHFYEGKQYYPPAELPKVPSQIVTHLSSIISYNPINDPFVFVLNRRIRSPRLLPMQEMLAI